MIIYLYGSIWMSLREDRISTPITSLSESLSYSITQRNTFEVDCNHEAILIQTTPRYLIHWECPIRNYPRINWHDLMILILGKSEWGIILLLLGCPSMKNSIKGKRISLEVFYREFEYGFEFSPPFRAIIAALFPIIFHFKQVYL